ncbi:MULTISPECIES: DUF6380 family protein [unclassified Streptomyces]|uniref:DUF6380 family protein n=1 Tax=unclassified Streptomyces TaxID=2593676 RepID=UPI003D743202
MDATGDAAGQGGDGGGKRHATLRHGAASLKATTGRAEFKHHGGRAGEEPR